MADRWEEVGKNGKGWDDVFYGQFDYAIDEKGRLSVPAKFRDALLSQDAPSLILTVHPLGCIVAYPSKEWQALQERIAAADEEARSEGANFLRTFYAFVTDCPIDRLGRILVPQLLRNRTAIQKNVVVLGMNKKIEIWSEHAWADVETKAAKELEARPNLASRFGL